MAWNGFPGSSTVATGRADACVHIDRLVRVAHATVSRQTAAADSTRIVSRRKIEKLLALSVPREWHSTRLLSSRPRPKGSVRRRIEKIALKARSVFSSAKLRHRPLALKARPVPWRLWAKIPLSRRSRHAACGPCAGSVSDRRCRWPANGKRSSRKMATSATFDVTRKESSPSRTTSAGRRVRIRRAGRRRSPSPVKATAEIARNNGTLRTERR
jgi:hypothetical protein